MRRLMAAAAGTALLLLPGGIGDRLDTGPEATEAAYALHFNDELVGHAYFVLAIDHVGRYRLEAFSIPAGKLSRAADQEVLETSVGVHRPIGTRPAGFSYSLVDGNRTERIDMRFDWAGQRLLLQGPSGEVQLALLPGTQDRLSYLLVARRLAHHGDGAERLPVATLQATVESRLSVVASEPLDTPAGRFDAVAVERVSADEEGHRRIWFDVDGACRLPLRIEQVSGENRTLMQLQRCATVANGAG
jgi:hypothetical protein